MRLLFMTFALLATAALAQDDAALPAVPAAANPAAVATSAPEASAAEPADGPAATSESATVADADADADADTDADTDTDAEPVATMAANGPRTMSGMSILGNEETPTSLVIVPWKSSRLGDGVGVTNALDDSPRALDRDVFTRELRYFELRAGEGAGDGE